MNQDAKRLIVVLGMHRSGTSAITRGLKVLGVELGENLHPGISGENDKGFWEDLEIKALNQEILAHLGSDWDVIEPIPYDNFESSDLDQFKSVATQLLSERLSHTDVFGVKDPRISRLLPFWKPIFSSLGIEVGYVISLRHPMSVVKSLQKRDGFGAEKSYLLWLTYMLSSLVDSGERRVVVDYDALLENPYVQLCRIAKNLGLIMPQEGSQDLQEYQSLFLDTSLRHTQFGLSDLSETSKIPPVIREAYESFLSISKVESGEISQGVISRFKEYFNVLSPKEYMRIERDAARAERDAARVERDAALAERDAARTERDAAVKKLEIAEEVMHLMQRSASWRLTRPLRLTARIMRYGLTQKDKELARQYYHRLPLPLKVKKVASFAYHQLLRKTFRSVQRRVTAIRGFTPPTFRPAVQESGKLDYVIWGVIDWHFRHQRPQQLALALASTGRRVFYVSPSLLDDERAGFKVEALGEANKLFQVNLFAKGAPEIYSEAPAINTIEHLRKSIGELISWAGSGPIISMVEHPFWHDVASVLPNSRLVYDCMDHHEGFDNNSECILKLERQLWAEAELTITTSEWLDQTIRPQSKRCALIRNAGDFDHFSTVPENSYRDPLGRRVIGYYGAIAEWFDIDLVEAVANQHPECCVLLIGADTINAKSKLSKYDNVVFTGEIPYKRLPYYLHGFDVCLLPFKVIPLTKATNPVKVYEYLSAGKPVVSVDLPEIKQFQGLVHAASDRDTFLEGVRTALSQASSSSQEQLRKAYAREQTWKHRAEALIEQAETSTYDPKVSVVVVTYNNVDLTRACLESLDKHSQYEQLEIIVVDNASSDGSSDFLKDWVASRDNRKLLLNNENLGFAAANNQGLEIATGEYLVLLNNDTYVTPGWIRTLVRHLERDKTIGLIGPVTNNIGNEAKIDIAYDSMEDMLLKAAAYTRRHIGLTYPIRTAAFFCVMMPRSTYKQVGPLDEAFGRGFFEDDDYCRRVEQAGLLVVCAEDVYVHHHLSASFNQLKSMERQKLFEQNKEIYERKWGKWEPHTYRKQQASLIRTSGASIPYIYKEQKHVAGHCLVCDKPARFFYSSIDLWRESLNCEHCRTTSRYRSIAKGLLDAISELTSIQASSLASLPRSSTKKLCVYDTQPAFYYESCAYPLPDMLKKTGWIDVSLSQYKPNRKLGMALSKGITNQNLECLTYADETFDIVVTSDVMEHVRLDERAHREIFRVLKPGGVYVFTVPHDRSRDKTLTRVQVMDPNDETKDVYLMEPEYHGDTNSEDGQGVLSYRVYGKDLETYLESLGFDVRYTRQNLQDLGIMNTELFYCRKE